MVKGSFVQKSLQLQRHRRTAVGVRLLLLLAANLCGCWSTSSPEPEEPVAEQGEGGEAKELPPADTSSQASDDKPPAELARIAKKLYQSKMYSVSRESLQSLGNLGTPGAYRTFAEIKLADSYFFNGEYNEAAKRYEEFAKNYPSSAELPYAKLQAARSYLSLSRGAGRDRKPQETALVLLDSIAESYPNSDYGAIARQARDPVIKELAAYDQGIIDFYDRLGNTDAVAERKRAFETQWGARLNQSSSGKRSSAEKRLLPLLSAEQSVVAQQPAETQLEEVGAQRVVSNGSGGAPSSSTSERAPSIGIRQLTCRQGAAPYAIIEVDRIPEVLGKLGSYEATPIDSGRVTMVGLGLRSLRRVFDCFGTQDLTITPTGNLELETSKTIVVSALDGPPRLLLSTDPRNSLGN
jgi:outer membrane assembly lipoprotein YfiO